MADAHSHECVDKPSMKGKACVLGSGPNGLAAAIVLAQAGLEVQVFEAQPISGGGARTMELTLPGFLHDFGSAVHPLAVGSPFFSSLPLHEYGLEWIHSPAPLAHPLDDGTALLLERKLDDARASLGVDGEAWCRLVRPFVEHWNEFAPEILRPQPAIPKHPWLMARFAMSALRSAETIAGRFQSGRTRALFAGLAAHSFLSLDEVLSGAFGMLMAIPGRFHAVDRKQSRMHCAGIWRNSEVQSTPRAESISWKHCRNAISSCAT